MLWRHLLTLVRYWLHLIRTPGWGVWLYRLEILTWVWLDGSGGELALYCWIRCTEPWVCIDPGVLEMVTIAEVTDELGSLLGLVWFETGLELQEFEVWFGDVTRNDRVLSWWCRDLGISGLKSWPFCSSTILSWLLECPGRELPCFRGKSFRFRLTSSLESFSPSLWKNQM